MILERLPHQIESCRAAADDANMFQCPNQECTQCVENLFNVVSQQTPSMTCEVEEFNSDDFPHKGSYHTVVVLFAPVQLQCHGALWAGV